MDVNRRPFQPPSSTETERPIISDVPGNSAQFDRKMNVFEAYAKVGSELKHTLKSYESNNFYLSNQLVKLQQEVYTLKKKRDRQKSSLVELQIKAEKSDHRKQLALEEFSKEKQQSLDMLNEEFFEVCENDKYISQTHEKVKQLLAHDKETVLSAFEMEIKREHEHQIEATKKYEEASKTMFMACRDKIKTSIVEEKNMDSLLDEAVIEVKNHSGLKEKYEYELQEKHSNLKVIENEVDILKTKLSQCKDNLEEMSRENSKFSEELVKTVQVNSVELRKKYESIEKLKQELNEKVRDLNEKEAKLNEVTEEHTFLTEQVRSVQNQIETITSEINELTAQIDQLTQNIDERKTKVKELEESIFELKGVHQIEKNVSSRKNTLTEKVATKSAEVSELDRKLASLDEKLLSTKTKLERLQHSEGEMTLRNDNAKKELEEMLKGLKEARDATRLKKMEEELSELKSRSKTLREQISEAEGKLKIAAQELSQLAKENSTLETEFQEVNERDCRSSEEMHRLEEEQRNLEALKTRIAEVRERVRSIRASKEFTANVEQIRAQIKKVEQEIEGKNNDRISQKEAADATFKKTICNLQEQIDKVKEVSEEEMRRRQDRIDRFKNDIPQMQEEISESQRKIVETAEKNIVMMKERLQMTGRLIEQYKTLQSRSLTADGRTNFTVMRMLGTIEEHLASSFRGMMDYLKMAPVDMSRPSYAIYRSTLDAFEARFVGMTSPGNLRLTDPAFLEELKNVAFCLFGLCRYSENVSGSDTTFFSPTSSKFQEF